MTVLHLTLQRAVNGQRTPTRAHFEHWLRASLRRNALITVRIVTPMESAELNHTFRGQQGPTNVLTFTYANARGRPLEGDIVLCAPVIVQEAKEQGKRVQAHYAHMTVHGALHLSGLDHVDDVQAEYMEARERRILARLGIADPYAWRKDDEDNPDPDLVADRLGG